jgi:hypothetical protein
MHSQVVRHLRLLRELSIPKLVEDAAAPFITRRKVLAGQVPRSPSRQAVGFLLCRLFAGVDSLFPSSLVLVRYLYIILGARWKRNNFVDRLHVGGGDYGGYSTRHRPNVCTARHVVLHAVGTEHLRSHGACQCAR